MIKRILRRLDWSENFAQLENFHRFSLRTQRVNLALSRAAATSSLRHLDPTDPISWSFCGFSQNNEDGITDYLTQKIKVANRYFIEIGAANGLENNTAWLAIARRYSGLMVEADRKESNVCHQMISGMGGLNNQVESVCMMVTRESVPELRRLATYANPDFFSIDIDGNDYYVAEAIMEAGFRPKVFVVEYNSAFGPTQSVTIKYQRDFRCDYWDNVKFLYYGVSISGWRNLFRRYGYQFVTVEENGVNAFFVDPREFDREFVAALKGLEYRENAWQMMRLKVTWEQQFEMIKGMDFAEILETESVNMPCPEPAAGFELEVNKVP